MCNLWGISYHISYIIHSFSLWIVMLRLRPVLEHLHELPLRQASDGGPPVATLLLIKHQSFGCWDSSKRAVFYNKNLVLGWFLYQRLWGKSQNLGFHRVRWQDVLQHWHHPWNHQMFGCLAREKWLEKTGIWKLIRQAYGLREVQEMVWEMGFGSIILKPPKNMVMHTKYLTFRHLWRWCGVWLVDIMSVDV